MGDRNSSTTIAQADYEMEDLVRAGLAQPRAVFAHQLDQEDGSGDGVPILEIRSAYSVWSQVFSKEYELLVYKTRKGQKSVMDRYGATNAAEFFAVATETFFEKPAQMHNKHPELYKEMQGFYKVNPLEWDN